MQWSESIFAVLLYLEEDTVIFGECLTMAVLLLITHLYSTHPKHSLFYGYLLISCIINSSPEMQLEENFITTQIVQQTNGIFPEAT